MGPVSHEAGEFFEFRCQQNILKVGFQFISGGNALPEPGELQLPLHGQKSFLRKVNQLADTILFILNLRHLRVCEYKRVKSRG